MSQRWVAGAEIVVSLLLGGCLPRYVAPPRSVPWAVLDLTGVPHPILSIAGVSYRVTYVLNNVPVAAGEAVGVTAYGGIGPATCSPHIALVPRANKIYRIRFSMEPFICFIELENPDATPLGPDPLNAKLRPPQLLNETRKLPPELATEPAPP